MNLKKFKRVWAAAVLAIAVLSLGSTVLATNDPLTVVNNLNTFVFAIIRAIGIIILGWGIVQFGLSLKSQDPSQRATSFLTIGGGIIITFAREILTLITGG